VELPEKLRMQLKVVKRLVKEHGRGEAAKNALRVQRALKSQE